MGKYCKHMKYSQVIYMKDLMCIHEFNFPNIYLTMIKDLLFSKLKVTVKGWLIEILDIYLCFSKVFASCLPILCITDWRYHIIIELIHWFVLVVSVYVQNYSRPSNNQVWGYLMCLFKYDFRRRFGLVLSPYL